METAMTSPLEPEIRSIIEQGQDLTLATLRQDGWPQATTVSYASDGRRIFFGCGARSQKARNLGEDDRISATIDLPYADWGQIRGLSIGGRARRLTDPAEMAVAGKAFLAKFPETAAHMTGSVDDLALFEIVPEVISVLDYRKGFGHTELVPASALDD
jgi:nitroimidazol reductase NimA-like FMN-containing flavoprotein (pyridoxamine 5'-phosphate oxidase superfamily)